MSPLLARKRRSPPPAHLGERTLQTGREIIKGAQEARSQQRTHEQDIRQQAIADEESLIMRERIRRLERFISRIEPEKRERVQEFLEETIQAIQKAQQQGMHPQMIKERLLSRLKWFFEQNDMYPDSPLNKQRVQIVMRYLKANEIIPR